VQYTLLPGGEDEDEVDENQEVDIITRGASQGTEAPQCNSHEAAGVNSTMLSSTFGDKTVSASLKAAAAQRVVLSSTSSLPYTVMVQDQGADDVSEEVELQELYVRPIHLTSCFQQDEEGGLSLRPPSWQRPTSTSPANKLTKGSEVALPRWEDESGVRAKTSPVKNSKNVFVRTSESPDGAPSLWTALGTRIQDSVLVPDEGYRPNRVESQPDPTALGYRSEGENEGPHDEVRGILKCVEDKMICGSSEAVCT
jgi:hypothetical protein